MSSPAAPNFQSGESAWKVMSKVPSEMEPAQIPFCTTCNVSGLTVTKLPGAAFKRETSLSDRQELISCSSRSTSPSAASKAARTALSSSPGLVYATKVTLVPMAGPLNSTFELSNLVCRLLLDKKHYEGKLSSFNQDRKSTRL